MLSSFIGYILFLAVLCAAFPADHNTRQVESEIVLKAHDDENAWQNSGKFEGDMVLNDEQKEDILKQDRNGMTDSRFRWPRGELVYDFSQGISSSSQQQIENSISEFMSRSCVRLRRRGQSDRDYVIISVAANEGCFSMIGRQGGAQRLNLGDGCWSRGTIQHEFLHAFGFYHMQSDPSRDQYVRIVRENIMDGYEDQFQIYRSTSMFGYRYDFGSVMHYNRYAFSRNGNPTIVPLNNNVEIGQRRGLSDIDIGKLNAMYQCS